MNGHAQNQSDVVKGSYNQAWCGLETLENRLLLSALYVSTVTDLAEDGTLAHPFDSIQQAINVAAAGDTVYVGPGTYNEDLSIAKDGLTLTSTAGAARTVIQCVTKSPSDESPAGEQNIWVRADGFVLAGFTIRSPAAAAGFFSCGMVIDGLDVVIHNNAFQVASAASFGDLSPAIQTVDPDFAVYDLSGLNIHNNTFTSYGSGGAGFEAIYINNYDTPDGAVTIADNTIDGKAVRGITSERSKTIITGNTITTTLTTRQLTAENLTPGGTLQGINVRDIGLEDQDDVLIQNNTVGGRKARAGFAIGIGIGRAGQALSDFTVSNNFVAGNNKGIQVNSSADEVDVTGNSLANNTLAVENADATLNNNTLAVENAHGATLNASGNWWGSNIALTVAAKVGGRVDYTPWLFQGTDTSLAVGFQGSLATLVVDDTSPQSGAAGRIQEAHDLQFLNIAPGLTSTVKVMAGTYNEDLSITKNNFNLIGAGRTLTNVVGTSTGFDAMGQGGNFVVGATGATITGFKFSSGDIAAAHVGTVIYLKGGVGATPMNLRLYGNEIECRKTSETDALDDDEYDLNGIETDYGNFSGVQIYNNLFTGTPVLGYSGIYVNGAVNGGNVAAANHLAINNNTFGGKVQRAIAVETSNTDIFGNNIATTLPVANAWTGIQVKNWQAPGEDAVANVFISKNTISGFNYGVKLGHTGGGYDELLTNINVKSNTITKPVGGTGWILVSSSPLGVTQRGNRLL